ncbi:MAG TPA: 6,7-dimethyl-8-ribityllumazine synthase [Bacteroidales bacterium]
MATSLKNLSAYDFKAVPDASGFYFGVVVSEWNNEITDVLAQGAVDTLIKHGAAEENIFLKRVPGAFELSLGAQFMAEYTPADAIICIGCVIKGETPHFDFICQGVTRGITAVSLEQDTPVIFGVLTTDNLPQAKERAGGKHGNKGVEAAITAIKMAALKDEMVIEDLERDGDDEDEDEDDE